MKASLLMFNLLSLLIAAAFQLPAQQSEADRKLLAEIRARADKGEAQSQFELGTAFYFGNLGLPKDGVEAAKWFRKAANQNIAPAQCILGFCLADGRGREKDDLEAVKWFRKAAGQNYAPAQYNLGVCYDEGQGVVKDEAEAVRWYRRAAEQNYADAQCNLGFLYQTGRGVAKDEVDAVKWFRKAAEQNCAPAQCTLGFCLANGRGVAKDEGEAVKWFRKAADQNYASAQFDLGVLYRDGEGVAKDDMEAVKWFRRAAEQDHAAAQCSLGSLQEDGRGVAKDEEEAVKWYRKAAEQNYALAQYNLSICYAKGQGVLRDYFDALKWMRRAAEQNIPDAQYSLGLYYNKGEVVAKDYVESYKWWLLAAAQGVAEAGQSLAILETKMSREQIAEGQKLARNYKPRKLPSAGNDSSSSGIAKTRPESSGTGFFITEDGYLITNEHVAGNGAQVRLVTAAGLISAKVVKVDAANDLALLKADGKFAPLPLAASRTVKLGGTVATIGFPNIGLQGFAPKFARGEIASLSGAQDDPRYFQISVPVQPGNSGGALVDDRGNVVGVVSAKLSAWAELSTSGSLPENVNYAVKSSFLLGFLESVPAISAKLKEPGTKQQKFEDVVKSAEQAAVLVLVY